jgi:hypothetical protein
MNRMRTLLALASVIAGVLWLGCEETGPCGDHRSPVKNPPRNGNRVSISQGIWGDVWYWGGNFMPPCPTGTVRAVGREIRIHELTSVSDVEIASGGMYRKIRTTLVATVWSDADGFFQAGLPVGRYSLFVVEDSLFYASSGDGEGHLMPVEVLENSVTGTRIDITYQAAW